MPRSHFQNLTSQDRRDALRVAQGKCRKPAYLLEKDIWVVATLRSLFDAPFGNHLIFKGGTSLSKVWKAITRFSEDVDITYDIRAFAPELVSNTGNHTYPPTRSQEKRWTKEIRKKLKVWVHEIAHAAVLENFRSYGYEVEIEADNNLLFIQYESLFEASELIRPEVKVDFGARSTGEPHKVVSVSCDAAPFLPDVAFPETRPTTMLATRTFWEKATAMHVFCKQQKYKGERLSRHWYDLVHLDHTGTASRALDDRTLALDVAKHKSMFFAEKDTRGIRINYEDAVTGHLQLVPSDETAEALKTDYENMLKVGMLNDTNTSFDELIQQCSEIEARANEWVKSEPNLPTRQRGRC